MEVVAKLDAKAEPNDDSEVNGLGGIGIASM